MTGRTCSDIKGWIDQKSRMTNHPAKKFQARYSGAMGWSRIKGTVSQDFVLLVFFINQFPPPPPQGPNRTVMNFFRKFTEIFASQGAPPVWHRWQILPPVSLVLIPVENLPLVSTIPAANMPPVEDFFPIPYPRGREEDICPWDFPVSLSPVSHTHAVLYLISWAGRWMDWKSTVRRGPGSSPVQKTQLITYCNKGYTCER